MKLDPQSNEALLEALNIVSDALASHLQGGVNDAARARAQAAKKAKAASKRTKKVSG